jgi:hypothetical protein
MKTNQMQIIKIIYLKKLKKEDNHILIIYNKVC